MTSLDLSRVGNVHEGYVLPHLGCEYRGLHFDRISPAPSWVIEDYALEDLTGKRKTPSRDQINVLLEKVLNEGRVSKGIGLGFVIVSAGTVNLSIWRNDYEHLPHQTLWTPERGSFYGTELTKENSYCVFEMAIAAHEANAWKTFLNSTKTEKDKARYVESIFRQPSN